ncbi:MAG TPA: hypothetical protein VLA93_06395 [Pyrinomonadaceae bacterium]|nr:hypothetical protein [Pyrinomonadaceae bacterium]
MFLPTITNYADHVRPIGQRQMADLLVEPYNEILTSKSNLIGIPTAVLEPATIPPPDPDRGPSPLGDALGHRRILRTSPLTKVPFVCCTNC